MNIYSKLKQWIAWGRVTNIKSDNRQFSQTQIELFDKVKDIVTLYPYGMHANAPLNNLSLVITVGHEENQVVIPMSENNRPKGLKEGEAVFGNFKIGNIIKFNADGSISITSNNKISVNAPLVEISGNVTIGGNLAVTGNIDGTNITGSGAVKGATVTDGAIDLGTHVHPAGTPPGNTGAPI